MVKLSDLQRREYENKDCVRFDYVQRLESQTLPELRYSFARDSYDDRVWVMTVIFPKTPFRSAVVYDCALNMPTTSASQDAVKVCEHGLHFMQELMKMETQNLSEVDFTLGDALQGA